MVWWEKRREKNLVEYEPGLEGLRRAERFGGQARCHERAGLRQK
jgi:hypothetical protein